MKKIRFISFSYPALTYGKIYDVIKYENGIDGEYSDWITIMDENELERSFRIYNIGVLFLDVTIEYRESIIDGILK